MPCGLGATIAAGGNAEIACTMKCAGQVTTCAKTGLPPIFSAGGTALADLLAPTLLLTVSQRHRKILPRKVWDGFRSTPAAQTRHGDDNEEATRSWASRDYGVAERITSSDWAPVSTSRAMSAAARRSTWTQDDRYSEAAFRPASTVPEAADQGRPNCDSGIRQIRWRRRNRD